MQTLHLIARQTGKTFFPGKAAVEIKLYALRPNREAEPYLLLLNLSIVSLYWARLTGIILYEQGCFLLKYKSGNVSLKPKSFNRSKTLTAREMKHLVAKYKNLFLLLQYKTKPENML